MARVESPLPSGEAGTGTSSASVSADRTLPENSGSDGGNPVGPDGVSSARPDAHALPGDADAGWAFPGGISLTEDDFADVAVRNGGTSGSQDSAARSNTGHDAVEVVIRLDARSGDSVNLTDISFIYESTYVRQGSDLLLIKPDGTAVLIENYFAVEFMPDITGAFGRRLTPELVKSFLQPEAPGQTASLNDNQVAQAQGESIGYVETLTGQVYAVRPDGTRVLLQAGDPVFQGDQIETARGGSIKITFLDGTIFTLGGDARLALDEMVYDPATQTGESAFSILKGGFLFVSGQIAQTNPNDMTVNTPVATIGIRGTIVTGEVSGDLTDSGETFRFTIVDGEISVTAGTQTIVLSENFATAVGSPDAATGGLSLNTFADNIQNVIARNASQFKALSPNDLQQIEFAIKQSVEARTGQPLELNLTDIVNSAPDPNNDIESDDNGSEEGPTQGTEEGGGIDSDDEDASLGTESGGEDTAGSEDNLAEDDEQLAEDNLTEEDLQELQDEEIQVTQGPGTEQNVDDVEQVENVETGQQQGGNQQGSNTQQEQEEVASLPINVTDPNSSNNTNADPNNASGPQETNAPPVPGQSNNPNQGGPNQNDNNQQTPIVIPPPVVTPPVGGNQVLGLGSFTPSPGGSFDFGFSNPGATNGFTFNASTSTSSFQISTGSGGDTITLGSGNDSVNTGAGNDVITAGGGNDVVNAGSGDDTIIAGTGEGDDYYDGGDGYDSLTYDSVSGANFANLSVTLNALSEDSFLNDGTATVIDNDTFTNINYLRLGAGDDTVLVNTSGIDIDAAGGYNTLDLSPLQNGITYNFGTGILDDKGVISTLTNFDAIYGGSGSDVITVTSIQQEAYGNGGQDTLIVTDSSLTLNLNYFGSANPVFSDGESSTGYSGFERVEHTTGTIGIDGRTITADDGTVSIGDITMFQNAINALNLTGDGAFAISGTVSFENTHGLDLGTALDMTDGSFSFTSSGTVSQTEVDINSGGRLIIGSGTGYEGEDYDAITIDVNNGGILEIAEDSTVHLNHDTARFRFREGSTLTVDGEWYNSASMGVIDLTQADQIIGTGTFANASGSSLTLGGTLTSTIEQFSNSGTLNIDAGTMTIEDGVLANSGQINVSDATLRLQTDGSIANDGTILFTGTADMATLHIHDEMTNAGTLIFDSSGSEGYSGVISGDSGAELLNTGLIQTQFSGSDGVPLHYFEIDIDNQGTIEINAATRFGQGEGVGPETLDTRDGTISIAEDTGFGFAGTLVVGNDTTINGIGTLSLNGGSSLRVASGETFTLTDEVQQIGTDATVEAPMTVPASNADESRIVALSNGNLLILYHDSSAVDEVVQLRIIDPDTGNTIHSGNISEASNNGIYEVSAAEMSDGSIRVAMSYNNYAGFNQVKQYQFSSDLGTQDDTDVAVNSSVYENVAIVAMGNGGYAIATSNTAEEEVTVTLFDSTDMIVNAETRETAIQGDLDILVDSNGNANAVYNSVPSSSNQELERFIVTPSSSSTQSITSISGTDTPYIFDSALLSNNSIVTAVVVPSFGTRIYFRTNFGTSSFESPFDPSAVSPNVTEIKVEATSDDGFIVAWVIDNGTGNSDIYAQKFDNAGTAIGDAINLTVAGDGSETVGAAGDQSNFDLTLISDTEIAVSYNSVGGIVRISTATLGEMESVPTQAVIDFGYHTVIDGAGVLSNERHTEAGTLEIASGASLANSGTLDIEGLDITSGGAVSNTGTITLDNFMRIFDGGAVDTTNGTFETAANSRALIGSTSSIVVGTDTNLTGTGTLEFATGSQLHVNLDENFSYDAGDALLLLQGGSSVIGEGTFTVNRDLSLGAGNTIAVDNVVSSGTLGLTGGNFTGTGAFNNTGLMQLVATGSDISVDLTSYQFENSGTLTLAGGNSAGIHASLAVSDFTNTGTINLVPSEDAAGGTLTVGGGTGTLTNDGLINNDVVSGTSFGGATIEGHVINSGTIFIGNHATSLITDFRPLTITEDITLTRTSRLVMEMGNGNLLTNNHSAGLDVGGTINFQGTLELRVGDGYDYTALPLLGSGPQIQADTTSGSFHRVLIMNETGTGDANFSLLNKIVIPTFDEGSFHLDTTGLLGSLLGGTGNERLFGTLGDDVFDSGADGSSVWFGLSGDDSFTLQAGASITYLDAGRGGRDILYLEELGFTSDTDNIWRVNNLEALDFTGAAGGTIDMSADFVFGASETSNALISGLGITDALKENALVIEGNVGQTLSFAADFSEWVNTGITVSVDHDNSGTPSSYAIYSASNGSANAFIDTNMDVQIGMNPI